MRAVSLGLFGTAVTVAWAAAAPPPPTFNGQVDAILRRHCDECHHEGDVGPGAYTEYAVARDAASLMVDEIEAGRMPPWKPTHGVGKFLGERGVSPRELDTLRRWRDAGAPEGPRSARRRPVTYPDGWTLGPPDALLDYGEPFTVPAGGDDIYRCFPVKNPFGRDVWLSAIDVHPGDRRVVHHVVMYVDSGGQSAAKDAADPGPGYTCFGGPATPNPMVLGGWAPGNPRNPNVPPVDVSYGERTVDEMCLAFLAVTLGPAKADAPPVVTRASWDKSGGFVVSARNLGGGGRIEVNGVALADSESIGTGRLRSASDYSAFFTLNDPTPPVPAEIRVRRADGRLSKPYTLTF